MANLETATFGGGCFWCTEAIFKMLKGVDSVLPGYSGGESKNPTYEEVSSGKSGHAEAIEIKYDPSIIPYEKILEVFFHTHNPTTLNQQGADVGPQYRSVVFYHNDDQKLAVEKAIQELNDSKYYPDPVVTEVAPYKLFVVAEDYHQNYYENHKDAMYCSVVIDPKLKKLISEYSDLLK